MFAFIGTCKRSVRENSGHLPRAGLCARVCRRVFCRFPVVPLLNLRLDIDEVVCVLALRRQHIINEQLVCSVVSDRSSGSPDGLTLRFVLPHKGKKEKKKKRNAFVWFYVYRRSGNIASGYIHTCTETNRIGWYTFADIMSTNVSHMSSTAWCTSLCRDSIHSQPTLLPCLQASVHVGQSESRLMNAIHYGYVNTVCMCVFLCASLVCVCVCVCVCANSTFVKSEFLIKI